METIIDYVLYTYIENKTAIIIAIVADLWIATSLIFLSL